jgi:oligoendopeptidase F
MWETVVGVIVTAAVTLLASWRYWARFKTKLAAIRDFIDTLDDALRDDTITDSEYQQLWEKFKKLVEDP